MTMQRLGRQAAQKAEVEAPRDGFSVQEGQGGEGLLIQSGDAVIARMVGGTREDAELLAAGPQVVGALRRLSDFHRAMTARLHAERVSADYGDLEMLERHVVETTRILRDLGLAGVGSDVLEDSQADSPDGEMDDLVASPLGLRSAAPRAAVWGEDAVQAAREQGWGIQLGAGGGLRSVAEPFEGLDSHLLESDDEAADFVFWQARRKDPLALQAEAFLRAEMPSEYQRVFVDRPEQEKRVIPVEMARFEVFQRYHVTVVPRSAGQVARMLNEASESGALAGEWVWDGKAVVFTRSWNDDFESLRNRIVEERLALGFTPPLERVICLQIAAEILAVHGEGARMLCDDILMRSRVHDILEPTVKGPAITAFDVLQETGIVGKHKAEADAAAAEQKLKQARIDAAMGSLEKEMRQRFSPHALKAMEEYGGAMVGGPGRTLTDALVHYQFNYKGVLFEIGDIQLGQDAPRELRIAAEGDAPFLLARLGKVEPVSDLLFSAYVNDRSYRE